jgi:hypothetical protein
MNLKQEFDKWKKVNKQHGRQAFSRFIMLKFLDAIQEDSDEFIFKGGNLLWHYIATPRETIDLDLATVTISSHEDVKLKFNKILNYYSEITFELKHFQEIHKIVTVGCSVIIAFKTSQGQKNQFPIDIMYALSTDLAQVKSTTSVKIYEAASIENIICDKLSAANQFRGGNTRMKDFDDLWRISKSGVKIDSKKLKLLLNLKQINIQLNTDWCEYMN